jgi:hypothetical protein
MREVEEAQTLFLGILYVFLKIPLKKKELGKQMGRP